MGLEEASLFAERRIDELHEQVLALSGRLEMLARRFERLERVVLEIRSNADAEPGAPDDPGSEGSDLSL